MPAPPRFRYERIGNADRAVGTVPIGTIFHAHASTLIVEAWLPRQIGAGRRVGRHYADCFVARGSHLAQVRDLATGRCFRLADHIIRSALDK